MLIPHITDVGGWLEVCCIGYIACLIVITIWRGERPKHAQKWMHFLAHIRKAKGKARGNAAYAPVAFAAVCGAIFAYVSTRPALPVPYVCPESCLGVVKVEGVNAFETVNLKTGKHREWRTHANPPITPGGIFPGYVIEVSVIEHSGYEELAEPSSDPPYHIVRGKDLIKPAYGPAALATYDDGADRPVLARNCRNSQDDSTTICEGGFAQFETVLSMKGN